MWSDAFSQKNIHFRARPALPFSGPGPLCSAILLSGSSLRIRPRQRWRLPPTGSSCRLSPPSGSVHPSACSPRDQLCHLSQRGARRDPPLACPPLSSASPAATERMGPKVRKTTAFLVLVSDGDRVTASSEAGVSGPGLPEPQTADAHRGNMNPGTRPQASGAPGTGPRLGGAEGPCPLRGSRGAL